MIFNAPSVCSGELAGKGDLPENKIALARRFGGKPTKELAVFNLQNR